ncbi:LysR family transcriptional regulator [Salmonella enterica]|nr:LysR family transcriptional regulator [Salmonella enterica]
MEAAYELALSPSAMSHALNRLRASLDNPLFVRTGGNLLHQN